MLVKGATGNISTSKFIAVLTSDWNCKYIFKFPKANSAKAKSNTFDESNDIWYVEAFAVDNFERHLWEQCTIFCIKSSFDVIFLYESDGFNYIYLQKYFYMEHFTNVTMPGASDGRMPLPWTDFSWWLAFISNKSWCYIVYTVRR